jgi:hypothetical protein
MTLAISLPPATEALLSDRAKAFGQAPEQYARQLIVDAVAAQTDGSQGAHRWRPAEELTSAERLLALNALIAEVRARPPITHRVDDSRDSIYGGPDDRGEP